MELTPSHEGVRYAVTQELPTILWNLKVHSFVDKSSPVVPVLRQTNPACYVFEEWYLLGCYVVWLW
jgi:hypothetical protein